MIPNKRSECKRKRFTAADLPCDPPFPRFFPFTRKRLEMDVTWPNKQLWQFCGWNVSHPLDLVTYPSNTAGSVRNSNQKQSMQQNQWHGRICRSCSDGCGLQFYSKSFSSVKQQSTLQLYCNMKPTIRWEFNSFIHSWWHFSFPSVAQRPKSGVSQLCRSWGKNCFCAASIA